MIRETIRSFDSNAVIYLFGSRANDTLHGGDIDILVISESLTFADLWPIRRTILDEIGWQKLDLSIRKPNEEADALTTLAICEGVKL